MLSAPGGGFVLLWMAAAMFALFVAAAWAFRFAIALTLQWTRRGPRDLYSERARLRRAL